MNKLIKIVEVGEHKFAVATNKTILARVLEEFPKFSKIALKSKDKGKTTDNKSVDNQNSLEHFIETKSLADVFEMTDMIPDVIKFAFPLMLQAAEELANPVVIIDYIYENEVDEVFNNEMFDFLMSAFTGGKRDRQPKVKFAMK